MLLLVLVACPENSGFFSFSSFSSSDDDRSDIFFLYIKTTKTKELLKLKKKLFFKLINCRNIRQSADSWTSVSLKL